MTILTLAPHNAAGDIDGLLPTATEIIDLLSATHVPGGKDKLRFPLTSHQAEDLMDRDGNVSITLHLDQGKYFNHVIASASGDGITPENYAHEVAFGFGRPHESEAHIVGVEGSDFIVSYRTHILEFLDV